MLDKKIAPCGSWKSPITTDMLVTDTIRLGMTALDGQDIYWVEGRPTEGGRNVIVRRSADGSVKDITPRDFNVRTRVHEYGGGDFVVSDGAIYFANYVDQRLYRQIPGAEPVPMSSAKSIRYADMIVDRQRSRLISVCEDHSNTQHEPVNFIISLPLDGDGSEGEQILVAGNDFYANPRLSPDGSRLAWLTWNHPNMPWDGTELWVAELDAHGFISNAQRIAGGPSESIFQPEWSPTGELFFVSDRSGWWNLYRWNGVEAKALCPKESEFGLPQWIFGMATYGFVSPECIVCWHSGPKESGLSFIDTRTGILTPIEMPYTSVSQVRANSDCVLLVAGSSTAEEAVVNLDPTTMKVEVLRRTSPVQIDAAFISTPRSIEFPTENNLTAYGYYYPPQNPDYAAPGGELPPLLVLSHGGPTGSTSNELNLRIQYWTSRGFAVLDVNYGGSTGYGRAYRERLNGQWGIVDVDDCVNGARYLVGQGLVDGSRLSIQGGSAGGYTTLCALTFRDTFKAGASYYGISDLETLVNDTHKFESRYNFGLLGPYPEARDLYYQRSAIHFTDRLSCPVIFFQGLEDQVVPPNQAEMMVEALRKKKLPVAYIAFAGEQHGFRRAENIKRSLEAQFYFFSRVFQFEPADDIEPVEIENL